MSDPLDDFLDHPPTRPEPAALREGVLRRTAALVRRRRQSRRLLAGAALAAAAVVGLFAGWLWWPSDAAWRDDVSRDVSEGSGSVVKSGRESTPLAQRETPAAPSPSAPLVQPTALTLEWQAFDAPRGEQAVLYQRAGDRYEEDGDYASAVRCFGQAVQTATDLRIDPNDSWLVMALKMDEIERRKEK